MAQQAIRFTDFTCESHPALVALIDYAAQTPGLDPRNYHTWQAYRREAQSISQQWRKIVELVRIANFYRVTDEQVIRESESTWSGRYHWDGRQWEYYAGHYFPIEYRAAVISIFKNLIQEEGRRCK